MTICRMLRPLHVAVVVLATTWLSGAQIARGQSDEPEAPSDPIKADLDRSKDTYQSKIDAIKKDVTAALDLKIAAAERKKGSAAVVEKLTAEKSAIEENVNNIPPSLGRSRAMIAKRIKSARNEVANAYKRAVNGYKNAGNDVQANAAKSEQEEFLASIAPPVTDRQVPEVPEQSPGDAIQPAPTLKTDPNIVVESRWNFNIRRFGVLNQPGAFKIANGVIYHLDASNPVGEASIDAMGRIHLNFLGHRKITVGEAVVSKVANGKFQGILNLAGDEWAFEMNRR